MRPRTAADALEYPVAWLRDLGLSLDLRCACCHSRSLPMRMLVRDNPHLAAMPLGRIMLRLRCQATCHQPPMRVVLLDVVEHAAHQGTRGHRPRRGSWR